MKTFYKKCVQHPIIYSVVLLLLATFFFRFGGLAIAIVTGQTQMTALEIMTSTVKLISTFIIIAWVKAGTDGEFCIGFCRKGAGKSILLSLPLLAMILIQGLPSLFSPLSDDVLLWIYAVIMPIAAGVFEEGIVRGVIFGTMLRNWFYKAGGIMKAVIASSLIFGLIHFANLNLANPLPTVSQVIYAFLIGIFFAAVYLRTGSLWGGVIGHVLVDFTSAIPTATVAAEETGISLFPIIICLIYALIGLFLMRKKKMDEIRALWQEDMLIRKMN